MNSTAHFAGYLVFFITLFLRAHAENLPNLRYAGTIAELPYESLFPPGIIHAFDSRTTTAAHQDLRRAQTLASCPPKESACTIGGGCCPKGNKCGFRTVQGSRIGVCEASSCVAGASRCTHPFTACCPQVGMTCGNDGTCSSLQGVTTTRPMPKSDGGGSPMSASATTTHEPTTHSNGGGLPSKTSGGHKTGSAKTGGAKTGGDKPGSTNTGSTNSGSTKSGSTKSGSTNSGSTKPGGSNKASAKSGGANGGGELMSTKDTRLGLFLLAVAAIAGACIL